MNSVSLPAVKVPAALAMALDCELAAKDSAMAGKDSSALQQLEPSFVTSGTASTVQEITRAVSAAL